MSEQMSGPEKFVKRAPVEAIRWDGNNYEEVSAFAPGSWAPYGDVLILSSSASLAPGNWIVKNEDGRMWPVSAADFARDYRRADEPIEVPVHLRTRIVSEQEAQELAQEGIPAVGYVTDDERVARLVEGLRTAEKWTGNDLLIAGLVHDGIIRQEDVE